MHLPSTCLLFTSLALGTGLVIAADEAVDQGLALLEQTKLDFLPVYRTAGKRKKVVIIINAPAAANSFEGDFYLACVS